MSLHGCATNLVSTPRTYKHPAAGGWGLLRGAACCCLKCFTATKDNVKVLSPAPSLLTCCRACFVIICCRACFVVFEGMCYLSTAVEDDVKVLSPAPSLLICCRACFVVFECICYLSTAVEDEDVVKCLAGEVSQQLFTHSCSRR